MKKGKVMLSLLFCITGGFKYHMPQFSESKRQKPGNSPLSAYNIFPKLKFTVRNSSKPGLPHREQPFISGAQDNDMFLKCQP